MNRLGKGYDIPWMAGLAGATLPCLFSLLSETRHKGLLDSSWQEPGSCTTHSVVRMRERVRITGTGQNEGIEYV